MQRLRRYFEVIIFGRCSCHIKSYIDLDLCGSLDCTLVSILKDFTELRSAIAIKSERIWNLEDTKMRPRLGQTLIG